MKYIFLTILFVICFICSAILIINSFTTLCEIDCEDNDYKETFGIDNGWYGGIIFLVLGILSILQSLKQTKIRKKIINLGIIIGSFISIYFLYLQQFVLKKYCVYCLIIDFSILVCLGTIIFWRDRKWLKKNKLKSN